MYKQLIFVVLIIIAIFWYLLEKIGYIPNDDFQVNASFTENFSNDDKTNIDKLYQKVPSYSNDIKGVNYYKDTSILRNMRTIPIQQKITMVDEHPDIMSKTKELDYYQMNKILNNILEGENTIKIDKTVIDEDIIGHYINALINKEIINSEFINPYHSYEYFKVNEIELITKKQVWSSSNSLNSNVEYVINLFIKRNLKVHYFAITSSVLVTNDSLVIKNLKLIGMPMDKIIDNNIIVDSEDNDIYDNNNEKYKCFHPSGLDGELPYYKTYEHCTSYHPEVNGNGVWDKPCEKDSDCPYYKANKNYPNNFGGCINGKCEMPLGIERIGYKKIIKNSKPYCYNCSSNLDIGLDKNKCCSIQKENIINNNVSYKSPDYMFYEDSSVRLENKEKLEQYGLNANPTLI